MFSYNKWVGVRKIDELCSRNGFRSGLRLNIVGETMTVCGTFGHEVRWLVRMRLACLARLGRAPSHHGLARGTFRLPSDGPWVASGLP